MTIGYSGSTLYDVVTVKEVLVPISQALVRPRPSFIGSEELPCNNENDKNRTTYEIQSHNRFENVRQIGLDAQ